MKLSLTLIACIFVLGYGIFEGIWTRRWTEKKGTEEGVAKLKTLPADIGPWRGIKRTMDEQQKKIGQVDGYYQYIFRHEVTNKEVLVLLVCGRPGPTCVHTPDVCYRGIGFRPVGTKEPKSYKDKSTGEQAHFWFQKFQKTGGNVNQKVEIHWSWSADGTWRIPSYPRYAFGHYPALYKLYIHRDIAPFEGQTETKDKTSEEFLKVFLPVLQKHLFPAKKD